MENLKYTILALTIVGILACVKDLDRFPRDQQSTSTFFKTESDALDALAGIYEELQQWAYQMPHIDCATNLAENRGGSWGLVGTLSHNEQSGPSSIVWNRAYRAIARINYLINHVDNIPSDESIINTFKAEGKFLRAYFYHILIHHFGDVPHYSEQLTVEELNSIERTPKETVLDHILKDLNDAIATLPIVPDEIYRASRGAGLAVKTRILLYEKDWQGVIETYSSWKAIATEAGYGLADNYRDMFLKAGENGPEAIFQVNLVGDGIDNLLTQRDWRAYRQIQPFESTIDDHEIIGTTDPSNPFEGRDSRAAMNIFDEEAEDGTVISSTGYVIRKGTLDGLYGSGVDWSQVPGHNIMLVRYSDMQMMYAEATNELNGPSDEVFDIIDEIRTRPTVELPEIDRNLYTSKEQTRDLIFQERKIEFMFEGLWYQDMKRRDDAFITEEMNKVVFDNRSETFASLGTQTFRLLPIPRSEIDINPNLSQNPGY